MDLRCDAMLRSNLGNENSDEGHIKCSRGPQVPHPCCSGISFHLNIFSYSVAFTIPYAKRAKRTFEFLAV